MGVVLQCDRIGCEAEIEEPVTRIHDSGLQERYVGCHLPEGWAVERVEGDGQVFDYELKLPELSERWLQVNAATISCC